MIFRRQNGQNNTGKRKNYELWIANYEFFINFAPAFRPRSLAGCRVPCYASG